MRTVRATIHVSEAADRCAGELTETVPMVMRVLRRRMREAARGIVSVPQFRTLVYLRHQPGSSLAALSEHLGVRPPTASALVERLVQRGFVRRAADPRERRRLTLHLTPAGARFVERVRRTTQARLREELSALPASTLEELCRAMRTLREVFGGNS